MDISGAFDRMSHHSIKSFLEQTNMPSKLKVILKKLFTKQQVAIKLGDKQSRLMKVQRGII